MRRLSELPLLGLVLALVGLPAPAAARRADLRALEGGGQLLLLRAPAATEVDGLLVVDTGPQGADPERTARALVLAEWIGGGSAGDEALGTWLAPRAGQVETGAGPDAVRVRFRCLPEDLEPFLAELGTRLAAAELVPDTLQAARERVLAREARAWEDPVTVAGRALEREAYGSDEPPGAAPSPAAVAAVGAAELDAFRRAALVRAHCWLGLSGPLEPDVAAAAAEGLLANLPAGSPAAGAPPPAFRRPGRTRVVLVDRPAAEQSRVLLAGPGTRFLHPDEPALALWTRAVRRALDEQTRESLREELELSELQLPGFAAGAQRAGRFEAGCLAPHAAVEGAISALLGLLRDCAGDLDPQSLEAGRRELVDDRGRPAPGGDRLARELELARRQYPEDFWEQRARRIAALDGEAVAAAVSRNLDVDRLLVVVVGPAATLAAPLERFGVLTRLDPRPWAAAEEQLAALLEAVGGRESWRATRYLETELSHQPAGAPAVSLHVWRDLDGPRIRTEQAGPAPSVLVVDESGAWSRAGTRLAELSQEVRVRLERALWRELACVLRQLAVSPPGAVELAEDGRLVLRFGPARGVWLELDEGGLPLRLGAPEEEGVVLYEFSEWTALDGLATPGRIVRGGPGGWERRVVSQRALPELDPALFSRP